MARHHILMRQFDVFMYHGEPAVVLGPAEETALKPRSKYSDSAVKCAVLNADGSLGRSFELDADRFIDKEHFQPLDGTSIEFRVTLPADVQKQVDEYRAQQAKTDKVDDELHGKTEYHSSYGSIRLSKIQGHTKLFMSPFRHQHFIGISIHRASKTRRLAEDHMHGELRQVVEVFMSEAQFARFITSAYDGNGTPCTIHAVTGTYMPEPPGGNEKEKFQEDVEKSATKSAAEFEKAIKHVEKLMEKPTITKQERKELLGYLRSAKMKIDDSMPFVVKQMQERMEKIVAQAGIEVEAHINRTVQFLGLKSLTGVAPPIKMLKPGGQVENESIVTCTACHGTVEDVDEVWVDKKTGATLLGDDCMKLGVPYHIRCAPPEPDGSPRKDLSKCEKCGAELQGSNMCMSCGHVNH